MKNDPSIRPVLARKISLRFLAVSLTSLAVVVIIFIAFALPALVDSTLNKCSYMAENVANQFDNQIQDMINITRLMATGRDLKQAFDKNHGTAMDTEQYAADINLLLTGYADNSQVCRRIILDDMEGNIFSSIGQKQESDSRLLASSGYSDILQNSKQMWICPLYPTSDIGGYTLALSRKETINGRFCIITVFSDATILFSYIEGMTGTFFDDVAFFDIFGNNLYASSNTSVFSDVGSIPDVYHYADSVNATFRDHYVTAMGGRNRSVFIGYASTLTLFRDFRSYFLVVLIGFIAVLLLTMLLLLPMIQRKLSPLQDLTAAMKKIREGHTDSRVHIDTRDEIGDLGKMYNTMLDTLEQNTADLLQKEQEKDQLKYSLLISQIDPHFIFNTMNIITSLARQNRNEEIIEINAALIHLLQDRLRITPTEVLDSVEHEIFITQEYIKIVQIRTGMDVEFFWNCPDDLLAEEIPKNILQPIIENAIMHGLYDIENGTIQGQIHIDLFSEDAYLLIRISDNGCGISKEALEAFENRSVSEKTSQRGKHIGLRNIADRLRYLYPERNDLMSIFNLEPHGTAVLLRIPALENKAKGPETP